MKKREYIGWKVFGHVAAYVVPVVCVGLGFIGGFRAGFVIKINPWLGAAIGAAIGLTLAIVQLVRGNAAFAKGMEQTGAITDAVNALRVDEAKRQAIEAMTSRSFIAAVREPGDVPADLHADARELFGEYASVSWNAGGPKPVLVLERAGLRRMRDSKHRWIVGRMGSSVAALNERTGRVSMFIEIDDDFSETDPNDPEDAYPSLWHYILQWTRVLEGGLAKRV